MYSITIQGRTIGPSHPPFIIAEMSGNHNGSLERARAIIKAVAEAGADAIKLQTYTPDTMTIRSERPDFSITDKTSPWYGRTLYDLYEEAHTPWSWHEELFAYATSLGLIAFSTPFDTTAVDFLLQLNVPLFKIASFENGDLPLIRKVATTRRPLIISSGTATLDEIGQALETAKSAGAKDIILLKCTSSYPAPEAEINLRSMAHLASLFEVPVGLSDHTAGIGTAIAATALGAMVIEKHVTLSRAEGGVDAAFSLEPQEFATLVCESRRAWESLGSAHYAPTPSEIASRTFRRSLYVVKPVQEGEKFLPEHIRSIRPGYGLPPAELEKILQQGYAACALIAGMALIPEHIIWKPCSL